MTSKGSEVCHAMSILLRPRQLLLAAGTSKEKTNLKAKLRTDEKEVDATVQHYLKLVIFGVRARAATLTIRAIALQNQCSHGKGSFCRYLSCICHLKSDMPNRCGHAESRSNRSHLRLHDLRLTYSFLHMVRPLQSCDAMACWHASNCVRRTTRSDGLRSRVHCLRKSFTQHIKYCEAGTGSAGHTVRSGGGAAPPCGSAGCG